MQRSKDVFFYLSFVGLLSLAGFFDQRYVGFAPFLAFATIRDENRWLRLVSRVSLVGFVGSIVIVVKLLCA
jgi:hypothetical protein